MNKASEIWTKAIPYIKETIMDVSFETAFKKLNPEYIENGTFYFSVPNKFYKDIYVTMLIEKRISSMYGVNKL